MQLDGKVAVVTGASRGIGRRVAERAHAEGATVYLVARDEARLAAAAAAVGPRAHAVPLDVRDERSVRSLAERVATEHGGADLLVNNAGAMIPGALDGYPTQDFRTVMGTNVLGAFLMMRELLPCLRGRPGSTVVNVASLAPTVANPGLGAYAASKAALLALTEALREEVRDEGIRVAAILPGSTRTELHGRPLDAGDDWMLDPDDVAEAVLAIYRADPRALLSRVEVRPVRKRARDHRPRR